MMIEGDEYRVDGLLNRMIRIRGGGGMLGGIRRNGHSRYVELGLLYILALRGPIVLLSCRRIRIGLEVCGGKSGLCGPAWG